MSSAGEKLHLIESVNYKWGCIWLRVSTIDRVYWTEDGYCGGGGAYNWSSYHHHVPELSCLKLNTTTVLNVQVQDVRCWFLLGPLSLPVDDILSMWDLTWLSLCVCLCLGLPCKDTGYIGSGPPKWPLKGLVLPYWHIPRHWELEFIKWT